MNTLFNNGALNISLLGNYDNKKTKNESSFYTK